MRIVADHELPLAPLTSVQSSTYAGVVGTVNVGDEIV